MVNLLSSVFSNREKRPSHQNKPLVDQLNLQFWALQDMELPSYLHKSNTIKTLKHLFRVLIKAFILKEASRVG